MNKNAEVGLYPKKMFLISCENEKNYKLESAKMSKPHCVQLQARQNISSGSEAFIVRGRFGYVLKNDRFVPKLSLLNYIVVSLKVYTFSMTHPYLQISQTNLVG